MAVDRPDLLSGAREFRLKTYRIVCHHEDRYCDLIITSIPDDVVISEIRSEARLIFADYYQRFHHLSIDPSVLEIIIT